MHRTTRSETERLRELDLPITFEAYRRLVLKELCKVEIYKNFHVAVRAFKDLDALNYFATDVLPILKSCYDLNKSVPFAAKRLDLLTEMQRMTAMLHIAEDQLDRRGQ
jgi:hypothetical protein